MVSSHTPYLITEIPSAELLIVGTTADGCTEGHEVQDWTTKMQTVCQPCQCQLPGGASQKPWNKENQRDVERSTDYSIIFLLFDKLCLVSAFKNESHDKSDLKNVFRSPFFNSSHLNGRIGTPEVCFKLYQPLKKTTKCTRPVRSQATCWSLPYLLRLGCIPSAARDVEHGASLGILGESWSPKPWVKIMVPLQQFHGRIQSFGMNLHLRFLLLLCAPSTSPPFWFVGMSFFHGRAVKRLQLWSAFRPELWSLPMLPAKGGQRYRWPGLTMPAASLSPGSSKHEETRVTLQCTKQQVKAGSNKWFEKHYHYSTLIL